MKIKETAKNNIQITMSRGHAKALQLLLDNMLFSEYQEKLEGEDEIYPHRICDIWCNLNDYDHLL